MENARGQFSSSSESTSTHAVSFNLAFLESLQNYQSWSQICGNWIFRALTQWTVYDYGSHPLFSFFFGLNSHLLFMTRFLAFCIPIWGLLVRQSNCNTATKSKKSINKNSVSHETKPKTSTSFSKSYSRNFGRSGRWWKIVHIEETVVAIIFSKFSQNYRT